MNEEEELYQVTPKGIFWLALNKVGLVSDMDDCRYEAAWTIFELMMKRSGYIVEEEDGEGN